MKDHRFGNPKMQALGTNTALGKGWWVGGGVCVGGGVVFCQVPNEYFGGSNSLSGEIRKKWPPSAELCTKNAEFRCFQFCIAPCAPSPGSPPQPQFPHAPSAPLPTEWDRGAAAAPGALLLLLLIFLLVSLF